MILKNINYFVWPKRPVGVILKNINYFVWPKKARIKYVAKKLPCGTWYRGVLGNTHTKTPPAYLFFCFTKKMNRNRLPRHDSPGQEPSAPNAPDEPGYLTLDPGMRNGQRLDELVQNALLLGLAFGADNEAPNPRRGRFFMGLTQYEVQLNDELEPGMPEFRFTEDEAHQLWHFSEIIERSQGGKCSVTITEDGLQVAYVEGNNTVFVLPYQFGHPRPNDPDAQRTINIFVTQAFNLGVRDAMEVWMFAREFLDMYFRNHGMRWVSRIIRNIGL